MDIATADEIRSIARRGLLYAKDGFDRARYRRLLEIAAETYAAATEIPRETIMARFRAEVGYPTAKVGVDAAIFDAGGQVLLIQRPDSGAWALPGGWVDPGHTAKDAVACEVHEETTLDVVPGDVIAVNSQLPSPDSVPHTSVHVLYHCHVVGGASPTTTAEASSVGYFKPSTIAAWHQDHGRWAFQAWEWNQRKRG
jgi:ADP-ribose pyrophosphatase YjhB (NUDIX family)